MKILSDIDVKTDVKTTVNLDKNSLNLRRNILLPTLIYLGISSLLYLIYTKKKKLKKIKI